jgi:hypothetical protein
VFDVILLMPSSVFLLLPFWSSLLAITLLARSHSS